MSELLKLVKVIISEMGGEGQDYWSGRLEEIVNSAPKGEWTSGEECTYPGCFGDDKKLYFCGMIPKPCGLNNACVTDDEGHCIPVRLSGLVKKEICDV